MPSSDTDIELLQEFAKSRADHLFTSLVERHIDLVFSAALRQLRSPDLAREVTQAVFIELARQAARLRADTILAAWLYEIARRKSIDLIRRETRRRAREQTAAKEIAPMDPDTSRWAEIEPQLDDAMAELESHERSALVLRFFENRSLRDVGNSLGVSEDSAQKRVSRALQKLRQILNSRGAVATEAALATALSSYAVQAAPTALAGAIAAGAAAAAPSIALSTALIMTTAQKFIAAALLTAGVGTALLQTHRASKLSHEVELLQATSTNSTRSTFEAERQALTARVTTLERENEQLRRNASELMKLRAEVTRLSQQTGDRKAADGFAQTAMEWKEKENQLRRLIDARPDQRVPEMDLLSDRTWLDIARDADLNTDEGVRRAFAELRRIAKNTLAPEFSDALLKYLNDHDGHLPARVSELKALFKLPVTDSMLDQYEMTHSGKFADVPKGDYVISEKRVVDPEYDRIWRLGPSGYRNDDPRQKENEPIIQEVVNAYRAANDGRTPTTREDLLPYIKTPAQKQAFQTLIDEPGDKKDTNQSVPRHQ